MPRADRNWRSTDKRAWISEKETCPVCSLDGTKHKVRRLQPVEHVYDGGVCVAVRYEYECSKGHVFPGQSAKAERIYEGGGK